MTIRIKIKHDEPTSDRLLKVATVVLGGASDAQDVRLLKAGEETVVHVHSGSFVTIDETESKDL